MHHQKTTTYRYTSDRRRPWNKCFRCCPKCIRVRLTLTLTYTTADSGVTQPTYHRHHCFITGTLNGANAWICARPRVQVVNHVINEVKIMFSTQYCLFVTLKFGFNWYSLIYSRFGWRSFFLLLSLFKLLAFLCCCVIALHLSLSLAMQRCKAQS